MPSRASEWAARVTATEEAYRQAEAALARAEWCCPSGGSHVKVDSRGRLVLRVSDHNHAHLEPHEALDLARWIFDTFTDSVTDSTATLPPAARAEG